MPLKKACKSNQEFTKLGNNIANYVSFDAWGMEDIDDSFKIVSPHWEYRKILPIFGVKRRLYR